MTREEAEELLGDASTALFCDGFDDCILGIADRFGLPGSVVAYDYHKMIAKLAEDMGEEGAVEFFDFNIIGAWMGDGTPIFVRVAEPEAADLPDLPGEDA